MLFVVLDDFLNDEVQEFLGEFRIKIGLIRKGFEPRDLLCFTRRVRGREVMGGFEDTDGLCVFEPLAQSIDENGIETINAFAMFFEHFGGAGYGIISQGPSLSV